MDSKQELIELLKNPVGGTVELDLDMVEYHERAQGFEGNMSSHQLITYDNMPYKLYRDKKFPREFDTKSLRMGRAFHTLVLEPHLFDKQYRSGDLGPVHTSGKNEGKKLGPTSQAYKDWVGDLAAVGITVLPVKEYNDVKEMAIVMKEGPHAHFFKDGLSEVTLTTEIKGITFQVRPDWMKLEKNGKGEEYLIIPDLKKTRDIEWFEYDATKKYDYISQIAIYKHVISLVLGIPESNIYSTLVACDPAPYYISGEFHPSDRSMTEHKYSMLAALERYNKSIKTNTWPTGFERVRIIGEED